MGEFAGYIWAAYGAAAAILLLMLALTLRCRTASLLAEKRARGE